MVFLLHVIFLLLKIRWVEAHWHMNEGVLIPGIRGTQRNDECGVVNATELLSPAMAVSHNWATQKRELFLLKGLWIFEFSMILGTLILRNHQSFSLHRPFNRKIRKFIDLLLFIFPIRFILFRIAGNKRNYLQVPESGGYPGYPLAIIPEPTPSAPWTHHMRYGQFVPHIYIT
jgi:hypothetical protein